MKAYAVKAAGELPAHHDLDVPDPGPDEVRIRVTAASVNGFDLAVAAGYMSGFFEHHYPVVLGRELTGVVDAVGGNVSGLSVGDRVFGVVSKSYLGEGASLSTRRPRRPPSRGRPGRWGTGKPPASGTRDPPRSPSWRRSVSPRPRCSWSSVRPAGSGRS